MDILVSIGTSVASLPSQGTHLSARQTHQPEDRRQKSLVLSPRQRAKSLPGHIRFFPCKPLNGELMKRESNAFSRFQKESQMSCHGATATPLSLAEMEQGGNKSPLL